MPKTKSNPRVGGDGLPSGGKTVTGDTPETSLWGHIDALRSMLVRIVLVWLVLMIAFFICMPHIFDSFVLGPCSGDFVTYRVLRDIVARVMPNSEILAEEFNVSLINIDLTAPFFLHLSTSLWFAVVACVPYILYKLWGFISPALYKNERHGLRSMFLLSSVLFYIGVAIGYIIIFPITLHFLFNYQISTLVPTQLTITSYMDTFMMLLLVMGLAFQLPLLLLMLGKIGLLKRTTLQKFRRHAIVVLLILSAIITPTGDPFTLLLVALPLYLLYEMSIWLIKKD